MEFINSHLIESYFVLLTYMFQRSDEDATYSLCPKTMMKLNSYASLGVRVKGQCTEIEYRSAFRENHGDSQEQIDNLSFKV